MHLYIGVCLRQRDSGSWEAEAPDLAACRVTGASSGEALARIRLALEAAIAERLGREEELPVPRTLEQLQAELPDQGEFFSVHINLRHLKALARHQFGRWHDPD